MEVAAGYIATGQCREVLELMVMKQVDRDHTFILVNYFAREVLLTETVNI